MSRSKWATIERARDILGLGDEATLAEIKRAYHRLSKNIIPTVSMARGKVMQTKCISSPQPMSNSCNIVRSTDFL